MEKQMLEPQLTLEIEELEERIAPALASVCEGLLAGKLAIATHVGYGDQLETALNVTGCNT